MEETPRADALMKSLAEKRYDVFLEVHQKHEQKICTPDTDNRWRNRSREHQWDVETAL